MPYQCPVCGYIELPEPPRNFSICPSCGTEFGFDDANVSYADLRRKWILHGAQWFSRARHPSPGWNPWMQLIAAKLNYATQFRIEVRAEQSSGTRQIPDGALVPGMQLNAATLDYATQFQIELRAEQSSGTRQIPDGALVPA